MGSGGNHANDDSAATFYDVIVSRYAALVVERECHQFTFYTIGFLLDKFLFGWEIGLFIQFGNPAEAGFEGGGVGIEVLAAAWRMRSAPGATRTSS